MRRGVLDSALAEVGTVRHLLGRTDRVRMVVVIEKCGSKVSVPISGLGALREWDMACGKGCSSVGATGFAKTTLPAAYIICR